LSVSKRPEPPYILLLNTKALPISDAVPTHHRITDAAQPAALIDIGATAQIELPLIRKREIGVMANLTICKQIRRHEPLLPIPLSYDFYLFAGNCVT
jgi:hypothetical protein